jgi:hypothetical protein
VRCFRQMGMVTVGRGASVRTAYVESSVELLNDKGLV